MSKNGMLTQVKKDIENNAKINLVIWGLEL